MGRAVVTYRYFYWSSSVLLGVLAGLPVYLIGPHTASIVGGMTASFTVSLVGPLVVAILSRSFYRARRVSAFARIAAVVISAVAATSVVAARGDVRVAYGFVVDLSAFGVGNLLAAFALWAVRPPVALKSSEKRRS